MVYLQNWISIYKIYVYLWLILSSEEVDIDRILTGYEYCDI